MNFPDAPTEGQVYGNYVWDNQKWKPLPATFTDAPSDTKIYGRKDAAWVEVAISNMIDDLTISKADPSINLNKLLSGQRAAIYAKTAGSTRWRVSFSSATAEAGSNAGSDFVIARYGDNGVAIADALTINRATGLITLGGVVGALRFTTTDGYAAQFGGTAPVGFHVDGANVAIRPPPGGSIYFQGNAGTPTFGYLNSGALNLNNALNVAGATSLAALTTGGSIQFNQQAASVYQGGPGGILIYANGSAGYDAFISYWRPGGGYATNMGLMNDNRFGFGGWSVGAAQYRFWSREDFTEPPVHNTRLVYVGDYSHGLNTGLAEPYGGTGCVTGGAGFNNGTYEHTQRYRQLQVRRSDGYYGSEEA